MRQVGGEWEGGGERGWTRWGGDGRRPFARRLRLTARREARARAHLAGVPRADEGDHLAGERGALLLRLGPQRRGRPVQRQVAQQRPPRQQRRRVERRRKAALRGTGAASGRPGAGWRRRAAVEEARRRLRRGQPTTGSRAAGAGAVRPGAAAARQAAPRPAGGRLGCGQRPRPNDAPQNRRTSRPPGSQSPGSPPRCRAPCARSQRSRW